MEPACVIQGRRQQMTLGFLTFKECLRAKAVFIFSVLGYLPTKRKSLRMLAMKGGHKNKTKDTLKCISEDEETCLLML